MKLVSLRPPFFGSSKHKKNLTVSRSETQSFGSHSSSSSEDSIYHHHQSTTPKSVLSDEFNGGGKITRRELEVVLRRLGPDPPTEEEVEAMLAEAERGRSVSGRITLAELAALGGAAAHAAPELRETFAVFDADGDGRISAEELLGVFLALGDEGCTLEDCRRMIGEVDTDGDGFVCFEDFVRMMDGQR